MNEEQVTVAVKGDFVRITKVQDVPKAMYLAQKQREVEMAIQMKARHEADQSARIAKLQADIAEVK